MLNASSIFKCAFVGTSVIGFVGCRVAKEPSYVTPPAYSSTPSVGSVTPAGSPSLMAKQPSISLASTQDIDATRTGRSIDPELIPYLPKEDEGLDSLDEDRPQTDFFGSSSSGSYRSRAGSSSSGCTSGCCSH